jgi:hypothetical protein
MRTLRHPSDFNHVARLTQVVVRVHFHSIRSSPTRAVNTFSNTGSLPPRRQSHTATLLHNGKVLRRQVVMPASRRLAAPGTLRPVPGSGPTPARSAPRVTPTPRRCCPTARCSSPGATTFPGSTVVSAEAYDPAAGTWSGTGNLAHNRAVSHGDSAAQRRKVLVAGGTVATIRFGLRNSMTGDGTWNATGSLVPRCARITRRRCCPNGKVLVTGRHGWLGSFFHQRGSLRSAVGTWSGTTALNGWSCFSPRRLCCPTEKFSSWEDRPPDSSTCHHATLRSGD